MNIVGLKIGLLGTSSSMAISCIFPLMETEMIPGRMQQPITYVRGARDDFMIHDVKQPVSSNLQPQPSKLQCQTTPVSPSTTTKYVGP